MSTKKINSSPGSVKVYGKEPSGHGFSELIPFPVFISDYMWPSSVEPVKYSVRTKGCKDHICQWQKITRCCVYAKS